MKTEHELEYEVLMEALKNNLSGSDKTLLILCHNKVFEFRNSWKEKVEKLNDKISQLQKELTFAGVKDEDC